MYSTFYSFALGSSSRSSWKEEKEEEEEADRVRVALKTVDLVMMNSVSNCRLRRAASHGVV